MTWAQLGIHEKPCGFLNVCGYYNPLLHFLHHAFDEQFIKADYRPLIMIEDDPKTLFKKFASYNPPKIDKAEWALSLKNG